MGSHKIPPLQSRSPDPLDSTRGEGVRPPCGLLEGWIPTRQQGRAWQPGPVPAPQPGAGQLGALRATPVSGVGHLSGDLSGDRDGTKPGQAEGLAQQGPGPTKAGLWGDGDWSCCGVAGQGWRPRGWRGVLGHGQCGGDPEVAGKGSQTRQWPQCPGRGNTNCSGLSAIPHHCIPALLQFYKIFESHTQLMLGFHDWLFYGWQAFFPGILEDV